MAKRETLKKTLLLLFSLLITVAFSEATLRLIYPKSDIFPADPAKDPALGHKILPYQSGHDANGFRNDSVAGRYPIVCIGDSLMYGNNVPRRKAIPQLLGRLLGVPVYNMGMGGYGPVQYYYLLDEAKKMGAQRIIVSFYLGNDVTDAFTLATRSEKWAFLRRECETEDLPPFELCPLPYETRDPTYWEPDLPTIQLKHSSSVLWTIHSYLRLNSVFYAMAYESALKPAVQALFEKNRQKTPGSFVPASVDITFAPSMNLTALDLRHDHIRCGCKIIRRIIALMAQRQNAREELFFVIIPTRENIYHKRLKQDGIELPPSFECQVHYEREISRFIADELKKNGFRFVDVQPRLERAALQNEFIYPHSGDHHPNAAGYALIAGEIGKSLSGDPIQKQ